MIAADGRPDRPHRLRPAKEPPFTGPYWSLMQSSLHVNRRSLFCRFQMKRLLLFICLLPVLALAQTDSGTIRVLVSDGSTAPITEARVKLTNVATGVVTTRETGEE